MEFDNIRQTDTCERYRICYSRERLLTRRGVLWLGLLCDARCVFCYDRHLPIVQRGWIAFADAISAASRFRHTYGNRFVDFMGGEPTLYPRILDLIDHCATIGLAPTCITHGLHLRNRETVRAFKNAGIHDFLMSVHGVGPVADRVVQHPTLSVAAAQVAALEHLQAEGISVRFNVTVITENVTQLTAIARLGIQVGARVINFITFNPYFEWRSDVVIPFQIRHSDAAQHIKEAIDECAASGIEVNVRYFPLCQLRGYEQYVYTGYQLPFDQHEWDYNSWYDRGEAAPTCDWYVQASREQQQRHGYEHTQRCITCSARSICDGFHTQYIRRWGDGEAEQYTGKPISDVTYFIRQQLKLQYVLGHDRESNTGATTAPASLTQFNATLDRRAGMKRPAR